MEDDPDNEQDILLQAELTEKSWSRGDTINTAIAMEMPPEYLQQILLEGESDVNMRYPTKSNLLNSKYFVTNPSSQIPTKYFNKNLEHIQLNKNLIENYSGYQTERVKRANLSTDIRTIKASIKKKELFEKKMEMFRSRIDKYENADYEKQALISITIDQCLLYTQKRIWMLIFNYYKLMLYIKDNHENGCRNRNKDRDKFFKNVKIQLFCKKKLTLTKNSREIGKDDKN